VKLKNCIKPFYLGYRCMHANPDFWMREAKMWQNGKCLSILFFYHSCCFYVPYSTFNPLKFSACSMVGSEPWPQLEPHENFTRSRSRIIMMRHPNTARDIQVKNGVEKILSLSCSEPVS
jgi:hypothetical protein